MNEPIAICIPLINPNEKEARLNNVYVQEGKLLQKGDLVASIESTKAALDIFAESNGFIKGLTHMEGDLVVAGEVLCYLVEDVAMELPDKPIVQSMPPQVMPEGIRITRPARLLAESAGIALSSLPRGQLVTEAFIRGLIGKEDNSYAIPITERQIVVFGGGGHGKSIIELVRSEGKWEVIGIVDDAISAGESILGLPVLGGAAVLENLQSSGLCYVINAVGGIGNLETRIKIFNVINQVGLKCPAVIHPRAVCENSATIDQAGQIFALAYVGSSTKIGYGCIVNTGAIVSHDCAVGDFTNISPGSILAGGVRVEERVMIGMGVTVNLNVKIGANVRIGNSATIKSDVPAGTVVKAGSIWPI